MFWNFTLKMTTKNNLTFDHLESVCYLKSKPTVLDGEFAATIGVSLFQSCFHGHWDMQICCGALLSTHSVLTAW